MSVLGAESGGVRTPGYVLAEMRSVNTQVYALNADIIAVANQLPLTFKTSWIAFVKEWQEFWTAHSSGVGGWWSRGTTPVYNKTMEFRRSLALWRDRFVQQGGTPSAPPLPEPKKFSIWPYVIGGAIVVGAGYYFFGRGSDND